MEPALEPGTVLQWAHDDRPFRILAHSHGVAMYDSWWPHLGNWGLASLREVKKRRVSYYAATTATVAGKATFVRSEPLTDAEIALHRPDLPFAAAQCQVLSWPAKALESVEALARTWRSAGCQETDVFGASQVYLFPFGPKGGSRAGVRVEANNGSSFSTDELVWKASIVQAPFVAAGTSTQGVGIYRLGLNRGIPAYYLWGARSRLHDQDHSSMHQSGRD